MKIPSRLSASAAARSWPGARHLVRLLVRLACALPLAAVAADVNVTYSNGQNDATAYTATAPDSINLTIATGTAIQSGVLSGSASVSKLGLGTLTLSGANIYTGGTFVNAGTLVAGSNSAFGNSAFGASGVTVSNATLQINSGVTLGKRITLLDGGAFTNFGALALPDVLGTGGTPGGTAVTVSGADATINNTTGATITGGNGGVGVGFTGGDGGAGVSLSGDSGALTNDASTITGGRGGDGLVGSGTGGAGVSLSGTGGTVTNTTGATITGGTGGGGGGGGILLGGAGILLGGNNYTLITSGTISGGLDAFSTVRANAITVTGGDHTLRLLAGFGFTGDIGVEAGSLTFDQTGTNDATLSTLITGAGAIAKTGAATLTLTGANTYTGTTTVSGGTLVAGSDSAFGNSAFGASGVTVGNATLRINSGITLGKRITLLDGGIFTNSGTLAGPGGGTAAAVTASGIGVTVTNTTGAAISGGGGFLGVGGIGGVGVSLSGTGGALTNNDGAITGGNGGFGGIGFSVGGFGGAGVSLSGSGGALTNNDGAITGGNGGSGGGSGVVGGGGGAGVSLIGNGGSLTNNDGAITGGNGGPGGSGGDTGSGGAGVLMGGNGNTLITSGAITGGLGTVRANALTVTGGDHTLRLLAGFGFTGDIGVEAGSLTFDQTGTNDATLATVITGAGAIAKTGAATLTLTGANTYTGTTTVSGGTLVAGSNSAFGNSAFGASGVTVSNATLRINSGVTLGKRITLLDGGAFTNFGALVIPDAPGTITGGTAVTASGADATIANTTGATIIGGAGVDLVAADDADIGVAGGGGGAGVSLSGTGGTVTNTTGAAITGGRGGVSLASIGGIGGAGVSLSGTGGTVTNTTGAAITGGEGGFGGGFGGLGGVGGAGVSLSGTGGTLTNDAGAITGGFGGFGGSGSIGGGGGGAGVSLSGAGGTLTNDAGAITGGNGGFGSGGGSGFGGGGGGGAGVSLSGTGGTVTNTTGAAITGGRGGVGEGGGGGGGGGAGVSFSGTGGTLTNDAGAITGGNGGFGRVSVSGVGGAGILLGGGGNTLITSGAISGGLNGNSTVRANAITVTGGDHTLRLLAGFSFIGDIGVEAGSLTFDQTGTNDATLSTVITGAGAIAKTGAATLTLTGANTYSGTTTVSGGTLVAGSNAAFGDSAFGASGVTVSNATLRINSGVTLGKRITLLDGGAFTNFGALAIPTAPGTGGIPGGTTVTVSGAGGTVNNNTGATITGGRGGNGGGVAGGGGGGGVFLSGTGGALTNDAGAITGGTGGNGALLGGGGGAGVSFSGTGGTLTNDAGAITGGNGGNGATVGVGGAGILLGGNNHTLITSGAISGGLNGNGTIRTNAITVTGGDHTLRLLAGFSFIGNIGVNAGSLIFDQTGTNDATLSTVITGAGAIAKTGAATLTLSGANTYLGGTTVSGGKLLANNPTGSATGSGPVTVQSGATLGGGGFITGAVTVSGGGILAPGNSAGTLTLGALTLNPASVLNFELGNPSGTPGVASDLINVVADLNGSGSTGALILNGKLNIAPLAGFGAGGYTLLAYGGGLSGPGLALGNTPAAFLLAIDTVTTPGSVLLNVLAAPDWLVWDGPAADTTTVEGGNGAWTNDSGTQNWTNDAGTGNTAWPGGAYGARFTVNPSPGSAATVTLAAGETVQAKGLSFEADGFILAGADAASTLEFTGTGEVDVWSDFTATLDLTLTGTQLTKTGAGTLILTGANTYTGGTTVNAGTLVAGSDSAFGNAAFGASGVTVSNATLQINSGVTLGNVITVLDGGAFTNFGALAIPTASGGGGTPGTAAVTASGDGATVTNSTGAAITGGGGGLGFGAGGSGGSGVSLSGTGGTVTNTTGAAITGGGGGLGFGVGGVGGVGVSLSGTGGTLTNDAGAISGGNGGFSSIVGGGGAGILLGGSNYTLITSGAISGGSGGFGNAVRANAITVTGGDHTLRLLAGFSFTGDIGVESGSVTFDQTEDAALSTLITGDGAIAKTGAAALALSGANSYTGGTTLKGGTLLATNTTGSATGSGAVTVQSGTLGGSGFITGVVTFTGGPATLAPGNSPGTLTLGGLHLRPDTVLEFELTTPGVKGGGVNDFIQVNGALTLDGKLALLSLGPEGTYPLIGYTGALVNRGLIVSSVPSGVNPGNLFITTATRGEVNLIYFLGAGGVQYWDGGNATPNGAIDGGSGVWSRTGTNWTNAQGLINAPWAGQTVVFTTPPGVVTLGSDVPFKKLIFEVSGYHIISPYGYKLHAPGNAVIQVNTGKTTLAAPMTVAGTFTKTGAGLLDLRAPASAAGVQIAQGALAVNSVLHSPSVHVHHGATLMGSGLIAGHVFNSGVVAPGNSIGTLTIDGNYTQRRNGALQMEVGSPARHDVLMVSGTARLGGTLEIRSLGYKPKFGDQIAFLVAGRIVGRFDDIDMPQPRRYRGRFFTAANDKLGILLVAPASYTLVAHTPNETRLARALDRWIGLEEGDIGEATLALDLLREEQYAQAFAAISPAYYEAALTTGLELSHNHSQLLHQQLNARRLAERPPNVPATPPPPSAKNPEQIRKAVIPSVQPETGGDRWSAWFQGSGLFSQGGLSLTPGEDFESGTFLVGADYLITPHFALGLFASYQEGWGDYDRNGGMDLESTRFGAYATLDLGGFYANAVIGGGQTSFDIKRPIQWATLSRSATSDPDGWEFFTSLGGGYDLKRGNWTFGPQATVQYSKLALDTFKETGAGSLNLRLQDAEAESLRSYLGGRIAYTIKVNDRCTIIPEFRAFWQHEYLEGNSLRASLDSGSGPAFTHAFSDPDKDSFYLGAGIGFQIGPRFYANLYYNADLGRNDEENHTLSLSATIRF